MLDFINLEHHLIAFLVGFTLDLIIGDPYWLPHPVRVIGKIISFYEKLLIGTKENPKKLSAKQKRTRGIIMVLLVLATVEFFVVLILYFSEIVSREFHPAIGIAVEAIMTFQLIATKCLAAESTKVYKELKKGNLIGARKAVSMIVGRDTENLSATEVTKAAVETVAENTSDGIIAPLLFLALGGPAFGFFYKSINTMDSMIGYKNERYLDFGKFAAKTDDAVNFIPARLSACFMIFSCLFLGKAYSARNAKRIYLRDRLKHESPNSAHTEATCAGALGVQLAGPAVYEGKIERKDFLGDPDRKIEFEDIKKANRLSYATAFTCVIFCSTIILAILFLLYNYKGGN